MTIKDSPNQRSQQARQKLRRIAFWFGVLAALAGIAGGLVIILVIRGVSALPELNRQRLEEARRQWRGSAPSSYDIEIEVTGRQAALYRVQVRQGNVISAHRNGQPLQQEKTWGTWSVPGMFSTITRDVENLELVAVGKADDNTPRLRLRARFDARYGYPLRYQRIQEKPDSEVTWKVIRFETPGD